MSSFRLKNGFRLQRTNRAARRWKQHPKKPFHHVSRDKILPDSWSISAALTWGFSILAPVSSRVALVTANFFLLVDSNCMRNNVKIVSLLRMALNFRLN